VKQQTATCKQHRVFEIETPGSPVCGMGL